MQALCRGRVNHELCADRPRVLPRSLGQAITCSADLGAILGEGHTPDPVQAVLDRQWPRRRSANRAGLAWVKVRLVIAYALTVHHCRVQATTLAGDLEALRGVREPEMVHVARSGWSPLAHRGGSQSDVTTTLPWASPSPT